MKARSPFDLMQWAHDEVVSECRVAYRAYHRRRRDRHIAYYAARIEQRSDTHPFAAAVRRFAFPPGWEHLAETPDLAWHTHHLSGGSSQVLAISLLGAAVAADPTLGWLWPTNGPLPSLGQPVDQHFEFDLAPEALNEYPRTTAVDWLVRGPDGVMAVEAKFMEEGFGRCSCEKRQQSDCSPTVRERPYWSVGRQHFGLTGPEPPSSCALSLAYQAVRNAAAAIALADQGRAVFLLLYDEENPYFGGAGEWPGWSSLLDFAPTRPRLAIRTVSWQQLLEVLPLPESVRKWAYEKHGLAATA